jgi:hypothetical protein
MVSMFLLLLIQQTLNFLHFLANAMYCFAEEPVDSVLIYFLLADRVCVISFEKVVLHSCIAIFFYAGVSTDDTSNVGECIYFL